MRRPLRVTAIALVLSSLLAVVAALPAAAEKPSRGPWTYQDRTVTGVCSFPIHLTVDRANGTQTTRVSEDGTQVIHVTGMMKVTLTNVDSGYSLALNIPGPFRWTIYPDTSMSAQATGPGVFYPGYPNIFHGRLNITYAPGWNWQVTSIDFNGHAEDVCAALDH